MGGLTSLSRRSLLGAATALALSACGASGAGRSSGGAPRVVALGYLKDADAALAVGVVPVAMPKPSTLPGHEPWTLAALGGAQPELIDVGAEVSLERVASLRPDLILATGFYNLDDYRDKLAQIAPVIAYETGPNTDSWRDTTLRIGRALGREPVAAQRVAETEEWIARARQRYPQLVGKTFTFTSYSDGRQMWTKNSADDVIAIGLAEFGLVLAPQVTALPPSGIQGMSTVSGELLHLLNSDLTMVLFKTEAQRAECEADPLFAQLDSVRRGAYLPVGVVEGHALAFPTVLSVRYVVDQVLPRLAEVVS